MLVTGKGRDRAQGSGAGVEGAPARRTRVRNGRQALAQFCRRRRVLEMLEMKKGRVNFQVNARNAQMASGLRCLNR